MSLTSNNYRTTTPGGFTLPPEFDYLVKIIVVGESGVGKSALLRRFSDDEFMPSYVSTIGVDFSIRSIDLDDKKVKLQIWDTAGQERFGNIVRSYYKGASGILLCIDVTDADSIRSIPKWMKEIEMHAPDNTPIVLVANKCDNTANNNTSSSSINGSSSSSSVIARPRIIDTAGLAKLGEDLGIPVVETSARDRSNIDSAFIAVARQSIANTTARFQIATPNDPKKPIIGGGLDLGDAPTTLRCCVIL